MPLILTPGQLSARAELYHQFGSLLQAGVPVIQALEMLTRTPAGRAQQRPLRLAIDRLQDGSTVTEALRGPAAWLPPFDLALIRAGEASGRLPDCARLLADYYADRARLARGVLTDLLYPLFLLHLAVFIFPPSQLAQVVQTGNIVGFVLGKLAFLAPLYLGTTLLLLACQDRRGEPWRAFLERVLAPVPQLGPARRSLALARLATALEALISAGVPIIEAWGLAVTASGSPRLQRVVGSWRRALASGETPAELLGRSRVFPDLFASLYQTGETSGQLDQSLRRLHVHYQEEGTRRMQRFAQWTPRLVYFLILIAIGYYVVSFWAGYFRGMSQFYEF